MAVAQPASLGAACGQFATPAGSNFWNSAPSGRPRPVAVGHWGYGDIRREEVSKVVQKPVKTHKEVAFWGICDLKYDSRLPAEERVRVLELGDGRASKFSQHGAAIKSGFDAGYRLVNPIKRAVMVENKKFTHDMFVQEGFKYLRPPTGCYPRRYDPLLASWIIVDLKLADQGLVVLKLCNRARGAGVVVCSVAELDQVLQVLLLPPLDADFERFLKERFDAALRPEFLTMLDEQKLHWWSNECPVFVAEACCHSEPVELEPGSGEEFDGTMRVAFALWRDDTPATGKDRHLIKPFEIDWLGGYWKLPPSASGKATDESDCNSLETRHSQIVSSFNSVMKRTAAVDKEALQEVYESLGPALPKIFATGALSVQYILGAYKEDPLFRAFALARQAAGMRARDICKAEGLFGMAKDMVPKPTRRVHQDLPERSVLSYIHRNIAVCHALRQEWSSARASLKIGLSTMPTNATAEYLLGCCKIELDRAHHQEALEHLLRGAVLDPDFKHVYVALGFAYLHLKKFREAIDASDACLRRHPDSPVAEFNAGQAIFHLLQRRLVEEAELAPLMDRARASLELARRRVAESWTPADEEMLLYFKGERSMQDVAGLSVHVWRVYAWRP